MWVVWTQDILLELYTPYILVSVADKLLNIVELMCFTESIIYHGIYLMVKILNQSFKHIHYFFLC